MAMSYRMSDFGFPVYAQTPQGTTRILPISQRSGPLGAVPPSDYQAYRAPMSIHMPHAIRSGQYLGSVGQLVLSERPAARGTDLQALHLGAMWQRRPALGCAMEDVAGIAGLSGLGCPVEPMHGLGRVGAGFFNFAAFAAEMVDAMGCSRMQGTARSRCEQAAQITANAARAAAERRAAQGQPVSAEDFMGGGGGGATPTPPAPPVATSTEFPTWAAGAIGAGIGIAVAYFLKK